MDHDAPIGPTLILHHLVRALTLYLPPTTDSLPLPLPPTSQTRLRQTCLAVTPHRNSDMVPVKQTFMNAVETLMRLSREGKEGVECEEEEKGREEWWRCEATRELSAGQGVGECDVLGEGK